MKGLKDMATLDADDLDAIEARINAAITDKIPSALNVGPSGSVYVAGDAFGNSLATNANALAIKVVTDRLSAMLVLDGSVYQYTANALELAPSASASAIADAVWDELLSGHTTSGSAGEAVGLIDDVQSIILQSNTVTEVDSPTIKLKISTTKAKTHYVTGNLTGKTLKLYVESVPGVFFAEFTATGANGSFSFTPSSTLTQSVRTFPAALREPSDGNNVLWSGNIEVAYAADAE